MTRRQHRIGPDPKCAPPLLPAALQQVGRTGVRGAGRSLVYFGGCDYFRLASHPAVLRAAARALQRFGLNVAASRLTTGNHRLYEELERRLAAFFGADAAVLTSGGGLAGLVAAEALAGTFTHALIDARSHPCLDAAASSLGCPVRRFAHRDPAALARAVGRLRRPHRVVVLTDGLFAHDGSVAPLRAYLRVLPKNAVLVVDDAHGAGLLGEHGRGTPEYDGVGRARLVQLITLSKALGAHGGAILGSRALRRRIFSRSALFAAHTPPPLPVVAAALESLRLLQTQPRLHQRLRRNSRWVKAALRAAGVDVPDTPGPIVQVVPPDAARAAALTRRLLAAGIHPPFIRYPGGPARGYFRFAISSEHTPEELRRLVRAVVAALRPGQGPPASQAPSPPESRGRGKG